MFSELERAGIEIFSIAQFQNYSNWLLHAVWEALSNKLATVDPSCLTGDDANDEAILAIELEALNLKKIYRDYLHARTGSDKVRSINERHDAYFEERKLQARRKTL